MMCKLCADEIIEGCDIVNYTGETVCAACARSIAMEYIEKSTLNIKEV